MVAIRQSPFGGMVPAVDDRLLPDVNAVHSRDTWLYSGTVVGLPQAKALHTLVGTDVGKVYRLPFVENNSLHLYNSRWMEFNHPDTDVVRSQVIGDTYDRFYWVSPNSPPKYAPLSVIYNDISGVATGGVPRPDIPHGYTLGVPSPPAPTHTVTTVGSSPTLKTVSYVYTWVSAYGEEGPPSLPLTIANVKIDATITLTLTAADPAHVAPSAAWPATPDTKNLTKTRIYRTVVGADGTTTFFFVAEIPIATLTYVDNYLVNTDAVISLNNILSSTTWSAPPTDLEGWVSLSNGMVVGFRDNELWFCEPFRMHAWPAQYTLVTEYPIIGLGVANQTLVVTTEGFVYTATGIHPASMLLSKLPGLTPCTSRGSIVSTTNGVYFSAPQGLILVSAAGLVVATKELIRKNKWNTLVPITTLRGAGLGAAYYGFGQLQSGVFEPTAFETTAFTQKDEGMARTGVLIDPTSLHVGFNLLSSVDPIVNVFNDAWSAELLIIREGKVWWLDIGDTLQAKDTFVWRSKIMQLSFAHNLQAMKVYFDQNPVWPIQYVQWDRIPNMTGPTVRGVTITADSSIPGYDAWRAAYSAPGSAWTSGAAALPHTLLVTLPRSTRISSYEIGGPPSAVSSLNAAPKSWTLSGSNDGVVYTLMDTRTSVPDWNSDEVRTYTIANPVAYKYVKLNVTAVKSGNVVTISNFQLHEPVLGVIRVYADSRLVMERALIKNGEQWRLPSGFTADFWQYEIEAAVEVFSLQMATSVNELEAV